LTVRRERLAEVADGLKKVAPMADWVIRASGIRGLAAYANALHTCRLRPRPVQNRAFRERLLNL